MRFTYRHQVFLAATLLLFAVAASAVTITGKVTNATTGKPAAGDTVDLLALQQGMNVLSSAKTDATGSFTFNVDDANSPHLIRVSHDGVNYFPAGGPLRPGMTSASIDVYDATRTIVGDGARHTGVAGSGLIFTLLLLLFL